MPDMTESNESSSSTADHKTGITLTRRSLFVGTASLFVIGCATARPTSVVIAAAAPVPATTGSAVPPMYYAMPDEEFPIPEVKVAEVDPKFWRQEVDYPTDERPGTLIVDTPAKRLRSRSAVHNSRTPCWRHGVAIRPSCMRSPAARPAINMARSVVQCAAVSESRSSVGDSNHCLGAT